MTEPTPCHVCGEAIAPDRAATCNNCQEPFHLRTRQDQDGTDCGDVWINDQYLSLEFACNVCLGKAGKEPPIGESH